MSLFGKLFGKQGRSMGSGPNSSGGIGAPDVGTSIALDNPAVIDLLSLSPDGKSILLHVVAGEPWDAQGMRAMQLQAKLKNYVGFVADGQLARAHPEARGKHVSIRIDTQHPLGTREQQLVNAVRESWCKPAGIGLEVEPL